MYVITSENPGFSITASLLTGVPCIGQKIDVSISVSHGLKKGALQRWARVWFDAGG